MLWEDSKLPNVQHYHSEEGRTWIYNPPCSLHIRLWERKIGIFRHILGSMLSKHQQFTFQSGGSLYPVVSVSAILIVCTPI